MAFSGIPMPQLPALSATDDASIKAWVNQLISALQRWVAAENAAIANGAGITLTNGTLTASGGSVVTTSGLTLTGSGLAYTLAGLSNSMAINPSVYQASLIGNPIATYSGVSWNFTTSHPTTADFGLNVQLQNSTGLGSSGATSTDNVAFYCATQTNSGGGNAWAINPLLYVASGGGIYGNQQVAEFDLDNYSGMNYGTTGPLAAPFCAGMQISGNGSGTASGAIYIIGGQPGGTPFWNSAIVGSNNGVSQAFIFDYTSAAYGYQMLGARGIGIDTTQATFTTGPLRIGNSQVLWSLNAAGTGSIQLLQANSLNYVVLGGVGNAGCSLYGNTVPFYDNTYAFGSSTARWTSIWAVNGAIQTSDPSLKTNIAAIDGTLALRLVSSISPITFRWADGGYDMIDTVVTETAHATETHQYEVDDIEIRDGVAVRTKVMKAYERPAFDHLPAVDESGEPIMATKGPRSRAPAAHLHHSIPRMVERQVTKPVPVVRSGRRTHWGWDAERVKAAFDVEGLDFGGYVRAENGTHNLRPDQLIPVLWRAVQELAAEVAELKKGAK